MKVLMINTVPTDKNGITNVIINLSTEIARAGVKVDLLAINQPDAEYMEMVTSWGGHIWVIPRMLSKPLTYIRTLMRKIRQEKYDVVHAHGNSATLFLEMLAAKSAGCKIRIAHSHNTACRYTKLNALLQPAFQALCTHRLACGQNAGQWLYGKRDFVVIRNGIDTNRFAFSEDKRYQMRKALSISDQETVVGHVGLFTEVKNQAFLLEVMRFLPQDYRLVLLGEGPEREVVSAKAKSMGLEDRVTFTGAVRNPEAYYGAFDIMTLPSLYEGFPVTLVEAQANGLPCLISDRITHEIDLTGNVQFLPIDQGAEIWAKEILATNTGNREHISQKANAQICAKGLDAKEEAERLKAYYHVAIKQK